MLSCKYYILDKRAIIRLYLAIVIILEVYTSLFTALFFRY